MRQDGAGDLHDPKDVNIELLMDTLRGRCFEQTEEAESRVVEQNVKGSEARDARLDCLLDGIPVPNVEAGNQDIAEAASSVSSSGRHMVATTFQPCEAKSRAATLPTPVDVPVS